MRFLRDDGQLTCCPLTFTGLSGNGAPIGWKAQVSSFGAGFVMLLASGKGSCVAVVERCVDVELLSSFAGLNGRGVKNGDHEPEKPAFIDPIFSQNQSAKKIKMGKCENHRFFTK